MPASVAGDGSGRLRVYGGPSTWIRTWMGVDTDAYTPGWVTVSTWMGVRIQGRRVAYWGGYGRAYPWRGDRTLVDAWPYPWEEGRPTWWIRARTPLVGCPYPGGRVPVSRRGGSWIMGEGVAVGGRWAACSVPGTVTIADDAPGDARRWVRASATRRGLLRPRRSVDRGGRLRRSPRGECYIPHHGPRPRRPLRAARVPVVRGLQQRQARVPGRADLRDGRGDARARRPRRRLPRSALRAAPVRALPPL